MPLLRLFLLVFNAAILTFLIYMLLQVYQLPVPHAKKWPVIAGGILLILAPLGMFFGFFRPSLQYFVIYPVAISLYIYMIKRSIIN